MREYIPPTREEFQAIRDSALRSADRLVAAALAAGLVSFDQAEKLGERLHDIVRQGGEGPSWDALLREVGAGRLQQRAGELAD